MKRLLLEQPWPAIAVLPLLLSQVFFCQLSSPPESPIQREGFSERQVSFASGARQLHATLTLPAKSKSGRPCVLLVSGTEPPALQAAENTEQMFAELARGLATFGIASLRYEQPPFNFATAPDPALDLQITNDAVAALDYLRHLSEVDSSAIFVIGHGVGGTMAPYISDRFPRTRGVVLMAAAARPLEEALAERKKSTLESQGVPSPEITEQVAAQNKIFSDIRSGKLPPARLVEGATVAYWRDRMNRDAGLRARDLKCPVLVLQGGLDQELTSADYDRLESILGKKRGASPQFHWFATLDHMFMRPPTVPPDPSIKAARQVDPVVIQTIANWIKSQA